jgi:hypothetical protein
LYAIYNLTWIFQKKTIHANVIKSVSLYVRLYEAFAILFFDMGDVKTMACTILNWIELSFLTRLGLFL